MARLRSAPSTQNATTAAQTQTTRPVLKEKTNTVRSRAPVYENDGNADKLVKNVRSGRGRAKDVAANEEEFVMAGALGHADTDAQTLLPSEHPTTTDELAKSDGQPPPPNAKSNKRPARRAKAAAQNESQQQSLGALKNRMLAKDGKGGTKETAPPSQPPGTSTDGAITSRMKAPATRKSANSAHERSEFSLSPSHLAQGRLSAVKDKRTSIAQTESAMKRQTTPAAESSIFALKNFKRRPRQPSMLQMVQQRTASARPSTVTIQASEDPTVYHVDDDIEDDEEFAPDAEGTPLRPMRARAPLLLTAKIVSNSEPELPTESVSVSAAKKRKSVDGNLSSSSLGTLKAKRQRLNLPNRTDASDAALLTSVPDVALPPSVSDRALLTSKTAQPSSSVRQTTPQPHITSDAPIVNSEPSSTPPTEPSSDAARAGEEHPVALPPAETERQRRAQSPDEENDQVFDIPNSTMAEPASSSPLPSPRTIRPQTEVMADPSTQASSRRNRGRTKATRAKPITTATLQSLLPKRRQPLKPKTRVSEYDIESDSDQDNQPVTGFVEREESNEPREKSRRQTKTAQSRSKKAATAAKSKPRQSKPQLATRKSSAAPTRKPSVPPQSRKAGKTYSRAAATTSDKENEDDAGSEALDENEDFALPDTSLSMYEAEQSKELEEARKKFAAVDEWDMEFESMSIEEGRSSSQEWR